jgi:hypothetical protein
VRRLTFAAVILSAIGSSFLSEGAFAQWLDLPDGIDNPRPRYYDYHPPGVFYRDAGPVGFAASGFVVVPDPATPAPAYGSTGYMAPDAAPTVVVPIAPRPLCGVYRYWQNGICLDRRGY